MKHFTAAILAAAIAVPATLAAQIKTIPGEAITLTATIEAIERATRTVTLKDPDGTMTVLQVPADVKRFNELKVGDTIVAKYYENIVLRKKAPGEKDAPGTTQAAIVRGKGARPGATASQQRTITATITAIDEKVPSITLAGPNNWTFSSRVEDRAALKQVKVGDRLDITWTEAVMVSAESPKK